LPVTPIAKYQPKLDEQMVPVAEVPPQDIGPWREALARLLTDRDHYEEISRRSRAAALEYAHALSVEPFEKLLMDTPRRVRVVAASGTSAPTPAETLSADKRRLLALRLRKKSPPEVWFPGADQIEGLRLFWFPHAGGGTTLPSQVGGLANVCPVRFPGRESRIAEAPYEKMEALVEALAIAIQPYLAQPFAFFGHSMGAAVAFELCRTLRRRGHPLPKVLIASAARAPQYRRNYTPARAPSESEFVDELRRLEGIPGEMLDAPGVMERLLPALQADAALYRNYHYTEDTPLECAIRAYGGHDDPNIQAEHLDAWREQTSASFAVRCFAGGHFYLREHPTEFRAALELDLDK
jgi:medium-chain acyl-[acyl-carrier-protein] hydrolase